MPRAASTTEITAVIDRVLEPGFLRHLGRLHLSVRRSLGARPGNTPMRRGTHPTGIELESYKAYDEGDEPRFLDWNAYARLEQLLVRRFRAEREAPLHVFIDASASMGLPERDTKFSFAVGLALSLAYVAVRRNDPVRIIVLKRYSGGHTYTASPVVRLPMRLQRIVEFCRSLQPQGPTVLADGVAQYLLSSRTPGLAIVISDFLVEGAIWRDSFHRLASRGFEVAALRPLGQTEKDPSELFRRGRLRDAETGGERIISLSARNLERYREALQRHLDELRQNCSQSSALFAVCDTNAGLEQCLFHQLPEMGLVH